MMWQSPEDIVVAAYVLHTQKVLAEAQKRIARGGPGEAAEEATDEVVESMDSTKASTDTASLPSNKVIYEMLGQGIVARKVPDKDNNTELGNVKEDRINGSENGGYESEQKISTSAEGTRMDYAELRLVEDSTASGESFVQILRGTQRSDR